MFTLYLFYFVFCVFSSSFFVVFKKKCRKISSKRNRDIIFSATLCVVSIINCFSVCRSHHWSLHHFHVKSVIFSIRFLVVMCFVSIVSFIDRIHCVKPLLIHLNGVFFINIHEIDIAMILKYKVDECINWLNVIHAHLIVLCPYQIRTNYDGQIWWGHLV